MFPNQNPTLTKSWTNLEHLAEQAKALKMSKLFQENVNSLIFRAHRIYGTFKPW